MVLGLLLGLICATKGWRTDEPTVLPGLFIVSLSSDGLEAMHDGLVTAEFQSPGFTSEVFDDSAVLAFRMWTAPNWKNDTLYIVVMGSSMHVIPLFYSSLPDPDAAKRISESLVLEK